MSYDWLIATPAWGERCVGLFLDVVLPAIRAAATRCSGNVRFMVHTDEPKRIKAALDPSAHRVLEVPGGDDSPHVKLGMVHREALAETGRGECIAFINADMVPSIEMFAAAERRFAEGKRMIMMAATRTQDGIPPIGAVSADLLRWTMEYKHPSIVECFWSSGRTTVPWAIYFRRGDDVVLRGFHLHPFAVMKDRQLNFQGKTIDADLSDNFTHDEIHVVTDANEAAFAEMSPAWRIFKLREQPFSAEFAALWAKKSATPMHRWFFTQRIAICGNGQDIGDAAVCEQVLRLLR
jgi:hypothetical protein